MNSWLFQGNPKFYKVRQALHHFRTTFHLTTWLVNKHKSEITAGDEVFFWQAGPQAGLVGWGKIQTDPVELPLDEEEMQFVLVKAKFAGVRLRVRIRIEGESYRPRTELRTIPTLRSWAPVARGVEGTNFRVPPAIVEELHLIATAKM